MKINSRKDIYKYIKFWQAIKKDDEEIAKTILSEGFEPNCFEDKAMLTPLHVAANYGATKIIFLLVAAGAIATNETDEGLKPIDFAKNSETFQILLNLSTHKIETIH